MGCLADLCKTKNNSYILNFQTKFIDNHDNYNIESNQPIFIQSIKVEEKKQEEKKQEEIKREEIKREEIKQEEIKREEIKQEEIKNEDKSSKLKINKLESNSIDIKGKREIKYDQDKFKDIKIDNTKIQFIEEALNKINEYRQLHGVNPLERDDNLCIKAFFLAKRKLLKIPYDNKYEYYENGKDLGINKLGIDEQLSAENVIQKWYNEGENYNYKEPKDFKFVNFAQMIWKNTEKFGIGYFSFEEKEDTDILMNASILEDEEEEEENKEENQYNYFYVALFYPSGNIPGKYKSNVLPRGPKI